MPLRQKSVSSNGAVSNNYNPFSAKSNRSNNFATKSSGGSNNGLSVNKGHRIKTSEIAKIAKLIKSGGYKKNFTPLRE